MEVRLAKTAGFCLGVKRAVDAIYAAIEAGGRVYSLGPVIHNETVILELKSRGVRVIENNEELKKLADDGSLRGASLVIRAHGIEEETEEFLRDPALGIDLIDATCPLVKRVQNTAREHALRGERVIIAGDPLHPEVKGILSRAGKDALVIENTDLAALTDIDPKTPACLIAQTTFNVQKFHDIVEFLKKRIYYVNVVNTICSATEQRQKEAEELSLICDMMIVIGGRNSSNTGKLYDICSRNCHLTQYIGTLADFDDSKLSSVESIGVTAGASTPYQTIEEVLRYVRRF